MIPASTTIPADVRERIVSAAAELFEQSGRQVMPTVDAVRRAARVDMNAASSVMKEWRRAQTAQAAPLVVAVPEPVQQAGTAAVTAIWLQAQELANESLRTAQTAWETERSELDALRQEMAEAFERQAMELEAAGQAHQQATAEIETAQAATQAARAELVKLQAQVEAAEQAHAEQRRQAAIEAQRADERMAERLASAQAERDAAVQAAGDARERAAGLAGQLQAMQEQNAALLAAFKPSSPGRG